MSYFNKFETKLHNKCVLSLDIFICAVYFWCWQLLLLVLKEFWIFVQVCQYMLMHTTSSASFYIFSSHIILQHRNRNSNKRKSEKKRIQSLNVTNCTWLLFKLCFFSCYIFYQYICTLNIGCKSRSKFTWMVRLDREVWVFFILLNRCEHFMCNVPKHFLFICHVTFYWGSKKVKLNTIDMHIL